MTGTYDEPPPTADDPRSVEADVIASGLCLPAGYAENPPEAIDVEEGAQYWSDDAERRVRALRRYQDAVYRVAARRRLPPESVVLDIGCGNGHNVVRNFSGRGVRIVGVDQESAIRETRREFPDQEWIAGDLRSDALWDQLGALRPALSICADVIEHVDDPIVLLDRLHRLLGPAGRLVLSTPDRDRVEDQPPLGPPRNPHHVREWAFSEMTRLVESRGFAVRASRHVLPRRFQLTLLDAKIVTWRALHLRAVPARRSCMVFELSRA